MRDYLEVGPSPCDEPCVQVGEEHYYERARAECKRYIDLIRAKLGPEPGSARLTIRRNPHEFGEYLEVAVVFDDEDTQAVEYAYKVESDAPTRWV